MCKHVDNGMELGVEGQNKNWGSSSLGGDSSG